MVVDVVVVIDVVDVIDDDVIIVGGVGLMMIGSHP